MTLDLKALESLCNALRIPVAILDNTGQCEVINVHFVSALKALGVDLVPDQLTLSPRKLGRGVFQASFGDAPISSNSVSCQILLEPLNSKFFLAQLEPNASEASPPTIHLQRLSTLGMLAGGVAHDFNNILAGILGHVSYLKNVLPQEGRHVESITAIEEGAKKASFLTQEILNFSKLDPSGSNSVINLNSVVTKTCTLLRGAISPEIAITWKIPSEELRIHGSEGKVAQVVANLVINARDALAGGGSIEVALHKGDGSRDNRTVAVVTVSDNGCGIPPEILPRVYEPYFTTKQLTGTGLGLSTVKAIVSNMRGTIDIHTSVGAGTSVVVELPLVSTETKESSAEGGVVSRKLVGGTESILVVDDEGPVRDVLSVSLKHLGYAVEVAASGEEAILKYKHRGRGGYDLVILDMLMPKIPGHEVFFCLKEVDPGLNVLVISGYSSEESVQNILDNGGLDFIQKPFTIEELAGKVRSCLDTRRDV